MPSSWPLKDGHLLERGMCHVCAPKWWDKKNASEGSGKGSKEGEGGMGQGGEGIGQEKVAHGVILIKDKSRDCSSTSYPYPVPQSSIAGAVPSRDPTCGKGNNVLLL